MIVYGSGLADGNSHIHEDLPTIIAGRGGDFIKPGRRIVYQKETPMSNLWVTLMDRMGLPIEQFGDATGPLRGPRPGVIPVSLRISYAANRKSR